MRTTKAISTISFNSKEYLEQTLNNLKKRGIISFWSYVEHLPEDDEGGKKPHIHLRIEPSKLIQTEDLRNEFRELDPTHPDKPKGCLTFGFSKFDHWYMYAKHDKGYLASKGQSRKYQYRHEDIVSSDDDDLLFKARSIDLLSMSPYAPILEAQALGLTWSQYLMRGTIPIQQINMYKSAWETLISNFTERNQGSNHINVDENGEII